MKIAVVGTGYVGLVTGACLSDFVEGAELLFCQTLNILADAVHLTVQQLRVFCGFQVR